MTGGLAFPGITIRESGSSYSPNTQVYHGGMTLRDWFAGMAMQTLLNVDQGIGQPPSADYGAKVALAAYNMADAMLVERNTSRNTI